MIEPRSAPNLRRFLHKQHTIKLRAKVVGAEQIVQEREIVAELVTEP
jgi:hypothetical protein